MRVGAPYVCAGLVAASLLGPGSVSRADAEPPAVRVLAAASLTEVVEGLAARSGGTSIEASFGSSGALARQIRDGAPADVFLSASRGWVGFLEEAGAVEGTPVVVARNRLVVIGPRGSPLASSGVADPAALLDRLAPADRVAIADEGVPAGEYARHALRHLDLLDAYRTRLVGRKDVRAVLHTVERGELAAGFVYATDAAVAAVDRLFTVDPAAHPPIEYLAVMVRGAPRPAAARRLLAYLQGDEARAVLADAGFGLP